jgi:hypothetical protein
MKKEKSFWGNAADASGVITMIIIIVVFSIYSPKGYFARMLANNNIGKAVLVAPEKAAKAAGIEEKKGQE